MASKTKPYNLTYNQKGNTMYLSDEKKLELGFSPKATTLKIPAKDLQQRFQIRAFKRLVNRQEIVILVDETDGLHNRIIGIANSHPAGKLNLSENTHNCCIMDRRVDEDSTVILVHE